MEDPAYLLGVPIAVVGIAGALVALGTLLSFVQPSVGARSADRATRRRLLAWPSSILWLLALVLGGALVVIGLFTHVGLLAAGVFVAGLSVLGWLLGDGAGG